MTISDNWQPSASISILQKRACIIAQIRAFFVQRDVLEVETPALSLSGVTDVHLHAFNTLFQSPLKPESTPLFLQTSPEFAMKRLLCAGSGCIFQICKSFRNEEAGRHHNPEFTMLEWYRVNFDHLQLIDEVDQLLQSVLQTEPLEILTYQNAFQRFCDIDPLACSLDELKLKACEFGFENIAAIEDSKDVLLQLLCSQVIEPKIGQNRPVALVGFPASQAALARLEEDDPRTARRFEVYFKGIELANGYHELADANEQLQRFEQDNQTRKQKGLKQIPVDHRFLAAMKSGLPDCSGVALGIDRLIMLACHSQNIDSVLSFSINNA